MDKFAVAMQRAMAAEIRSRLGRRNRSQAWLQREAHVPAPTWRRYFTDGSIEREVPLDVVRRIADVLETKASELIAVAEADAENYAVELFEDTTVDERADLEAAIERNRREARTQESSGRTADLG